MIAVVRPEPGDILRSSDRAKRAVRRKLHIKESARPKPSRMVLSLSYSLANSDLVTAFLGSTTRRNSSAKVAHGRERLSGRKARLTASHCVDAAIATGSDELFEDSVPHDLDGWHIGDANGTAGPTPDIVLHRRPRAIDVQVAKRTPVAKPSERVLPALSATRVGEPCSLVGSATAVRFPVAVTRPIVR
jgi:hypothetical protein